MSLQTFSTNGGRQKPSDRRVLTLLRMQQVPISSNGGEGRSVALIMRMNNQRLTHVAFYVDRYTHDDVHA